MSSLFEEYTFITTSEFENWLKKELKMTSEEYMVMPEKARFIIWMIFRIARTIKR